MEEYIALRGPAGEELGSQMRYHVMFPDLWATAGAQGWGKGEGNVLSVEDLGIEGEMVGVEEAIKRMGNAWD
jgi:hypothetical protein